MRERPKENKKQSEKQKQIVPVIQSGLILNWLYLYFYDGADSALQGTARVINYAGLVEEQLKGKLNWRLRKKKVMSL